MIEDTAPLKIKAAVARGVRFLQERYIKHNFFSARFLEIPLQGQNVRVWQPFTPDALALDQEIRGHESDFDNVEFAGALTAVFAKATEIGWRAYSSSPDPQNMSGFFIERQDPPCPCVRAMPLSTGPAAE
jgi:hypothetical protein